MAQIFLFTGENSYQLREERRRWIGEFIKKYGEENCGRVDAVGITVRDLLDEVAVMPFLSEKRLVVVEGVPRCTKEEIQALAGQIHPQVLLLFIEPKVDKRTGGAKELLSIAEVKEFNALKGAPLKQWMTTYVQAHNSVFQTGAAEMLVEYLGEDQDLIAQEIQKLALFAGAKGIAKADIELQVIPTDEGVIWKISDLLASGDKSAAFQFARRLLERGGDAYGLWAILLNMLKNLVLVHAAMEAGHRSGKEIADATGVHIFAVRSLQTHAKRAEKNLAPFVTWCADTDKDLKTGVLRSTDEAPQEILALIDRFILSCP